jgi:hypothetical protein
MNENENPEWNPLHSCFVFAWFLFSLARKRFAFQFCWENTSHLIIKPRCVLETDTLFISILDTRLDYVSFVNA